MVVLKRIEKVWDQCSGGTCVEMHAYISSSKILCDHANVSEGGSSLTCLGDPREKAGGKV